MTQYINTETGEDDLSEATVRERFPNMSICAADFPPAPYAKRVATAQPAFNALTQDVARAPSVQLNGIWTQAWSVVDVAADVAAARFKATVPQEVTMRQARLALLGAGLLATVNSTIAAMTGAQGDAARIEWEYSQAVRRDKALVLALAPTLSLTDAQLDALFIAAEKIE